MRWWRLWVLIVGAGLLVRAAQAVPASATSRGSNLHATSVAVARYNADGSLDRTFNASGLISVRAPDQSFANALAIQADGRIVVAGAVSSLTTGGVEVYVERVNPDGTPDASFGAGGALTTRFAGLDAEAHAVAVQPDGKVVVAGTAYASGSALAHDQFGLARYNADGSLDSSFGYAGTLVTPVSPGGSEARGVAVQPDGKILAAGTAFASGPMDDHFAVVRYNLDGSLDSSFGSGGVATADFGALLDPTHPAPFDRATGVAVQTDGKILVVGTTGGMSTDFAVARHHPDGSLDSSFGLLGRAIGGLGAGAQAFAVGVDPAGRIVLAGSGGPSAGGEPFVVARQNPDGTRDASFGSDGRVTANFEGGTSGARSLVVQPDGMIVVGGSGYGPTPAGSDVPAGGFALQRWRPDGTLDAGFGAGGTVLTTIGDAGSTINGLALQPDGHIVAAGLANYRIVNAVTAGYHRTAP
jgi:uncharacterized delta-60 repeat protein